MTGVSRNSDEPANETANPIIATNALGLMARTILARYETGDLTDEQQAEFMNGLEYALNTAQHISDEVPNEVTEQRTGGSSRECPLDVDSRSFVRPEERLSSLKFCPGRGSAYAHPRLLLCGPDCSASW